MTTDQAQPLRKQQAERRLMAEWLRERWPDAYTEQNVRLGTLPLDRGTNELDPMEARLVHNAFARWVDGIVYLEDRVLLVEAKLIAHTDALGQLELYSRILPFTPSIRVPPRAVIQKTLVYARPDPLVLDLAAEQGVYTEQFDPPWVETYLQTKLARQRQSSRAQRMAGPRPAQPIA